MSSTSHITKPQYAATLVDRPRLYRQLDQWQTLRAILIHAPAGFGKSSLVSRWIDLSQHAGRAAWVALDENDNDPRHFVHHLAAGLDRVGAGALAFVQPILHDGQSTAERALMRMFSLWGDACRVSPAAEIGHTLVVLDDLHCIHSSAVLDLIMACLKRGPEELHLILLARQRPALPIARLFAQGGVVVLNADDLRFIEDEVHTYLLHQGFATPSAADVAQLTERSEGWVTALHLAVLTRREGADLRSLLAVLHGGGTWVADYLADEVLNQQAPELRRFLLQTSLLEAFNAELCAAVTGMDDAYARLAEVAQADLFLIQVDSRGWFRYHHLFRELLQQRLLAQLTAGARADLHRRAAEWLASDGQVRSAVRHFLAAGAAAEAAALVERWMRSMIAGDLYQAQALLATLPHSIVVRRPQLMVDRSLLAALFDDRRALAYVREAEVVIAEQQVPQQVATRFQAELLVLRTIGCFLHRDLDAAAGSAVQAQGYVSFLDDLYSGSFHFINMHLQRYQGKQRESLQSAIAAQTAFVRSGVGWLSVPVRREVARWCMLEGNSAEATRLFQQLFNDWSHEQHHVARELFYAYCYGAENHYWQNQLYQAQVCQRAAYELAQVLQDEALVHAATYLAKIVDLDQRAAGMMACVQACDDLPAPIDPVGLSLTYKAYFLVTAGQGDAAWRTLQKAGVALELKPENRVDRNYVACLEAFIARGLDLNGNSAGLAEALATTRRLGTRLQQLHILALTAWQQLQLSGPAAARPALVQAAELARETGYIRVLLDIPVLAQLLEELQIALTPEPVTAVGGNDKLSLTAQEQNVLRLLAADCTYGQIAAELVISLNTVRTHVTSIYHKLGVHRRDQAVAAASRRGYLDA